MPEAPWLAYRLQWEEQQRQEELCWQFVETQRQDWRAIHEALRRPPKPELELAVVRHLRELTGEPWREPREPKGPDRGVDVEFDVGRRRIGIQVTEFALDRRRLRAKWLQQPEPAYWISPRADAKLLGIVRKKICKAARQSPEGYSELWLAVAACVPWGGPATFQLPDQQVLDPVHEELCRSKFHRAFVFSCLPLPGWPAGFEWSRKTGWHALHGATPPRRPARAAPHGLEADRADASAATGALRLA